MDFSELINDLFRNHPRSDGNEYSNQDVARTIGCDASYLGKLRRGIITNPGRDTLLGLARFFSVPINYFFPEIHPNNDVIDPDTQVSVALRSIGLNENESSSVQAIIDIIRGKKK